MDAVSFHNTEQSNALAYRQHYGNYPGIIFLCGHGSDMHGSKAKYLHEWAIRRGQTFLRFDYSGHGQSEGTFLEKNISDWTRDTIEMIDAKTAGPQILVGSSLGGWIMLNVALARPTKVAALVGIAAAPDFTEELIWHPLTTAAKATFKNSGKITLENPYSNMPITYAYQLIKDGRAHLLLDKDLPIHVPVRLLHGMQDTEVPWQTATKLATCLQSDDVEIFLDKSATHRFSKPRQLSLLERVLEELVSKITNEIAGNKN